MINDLTVIDIFAGPGGLAEGFSTFQSKNTNRFKLGLSIEKDPHAFKTLQLRTFFRALNHQDKDSYYSYLRGEISRQDLFEKHPYAKIAASNKTLLAELGSKDSCLNDQIDLRISQAIGSNKHWVLIGGPPCQAYSIVGRSRNKGKVDYVAEKDDRHFLYMEYLRIIKAHRPSIFVMENVRGIISSKINGEKIFPKILKDLARPYNGSQLSTLTANELKYNLYSLDRHKSWSSHAEKNPDPNEFLIKSEDYGVPQARHRVFVVGVRSDIDTGTIPLLSKRDRTTVRDVLKDLPFLESQLSKGEGKKPFSYCNQLYEAIEMNWFEEILSMNFPDEVKHRMRSRIEQAVAHKLPNPFPETGAEIVNHQPQCDALDGWYQDGKLNFVCNSTTRTHILLDLYRYLFASVFAEIFGVSPKLSEFPEALLPEHANAKSGHFDDRFRVQIADQPSSTITSHLAKDGHFFIHYDPEQCRSLTVREAARLQTFPDNYFFEGPRTAQFSQVGNAVPPFLAHQIAEVIWNIFHRNNG